MLRDTELRPATDEHFAAMIDGKAPISTLRIPPNGVDDPAILELVRRGASDMLQIGVQGSWMMVAEGEVVGLCGFKRIPSPEGSVEIGYGVAPERRRRGYATEAVHLLIAEARDLGVHVVKAETETSNKASERVLERNQFRAVGRREVDGETFREWELRLVENR
ncbi:MAG: GNAT family N-acetyltransferase [Pseudomonadota bacterium]